MPVPGDSRKEAPRRLVLYTKIAIAVALAVLLGWDLVVANNAWRGDTVSELTMWAMLRSLTAVFALGYIAGHLTWPGTRRRPVWFVLTAGGVFLAAMLTLDILAWTGVLRSSVLDFARAMPVVTFIPAYVLGRFCWPQVRQ